MNNMRNNIETKLNHMEDRNRNIIVEEDLVIE